MTRIIKKKKKLTDEEIQEKKIKAEGKNLQQSGDFFQNNKDIVTWVLVAIFLITCFGISGTLFAGCGDSTRNQQLPAGQTAQQQARPNEDEQQISYIKQQLSQDPSNEALMSNLAYSYQDAALKLQSRDIIANNDSNKDKIKEYFTQAENYYKNALEQKRIFPFAVVNLMTVYTDTHQYDKAIALGEEYTASEKLLEKKPAPPKTSDPNKAIEEQDEDFSPVLAKLAIAYANAGQLEKFLNIAEKAIETNPQDLELLYHTAKTKSEKKGASEKDRQEALELTERAASQAASLNSYAHSSGRLSSHMLILSSDIFELLGDMYVAAKNKTKAEEAYNSALNYSNILQQQDRLAQINAKMQKAGMQTQVNIVDQKETSDGIEIKLSNGKVVKLSKEMLEQERQKAAEEKKKRESGTQTSPIPAEPAQ